METDTKLEKKLKKILSEEFFEATKSASDEELKSIISQAAINRSEVEEAQKVDADILGIREELAQANEPYRATIQQMKAKIQYCGYLLKLRGKV